MSTNAELARIFSEMAAILELQGANAFRINAHLRVAAILRDLPDDVGVLAAEPARLTAIEGIGDGSARKIIEYVTTGKVGEHQKLLEEMPIGLLQVLKVPGLGPKTVRMLWEKAGVSDLATLQAALDSGAVAALPRMGPKTVDNIRESLAFVATADERVRLGVALPLAETIVGRLVGVEGVKKIQYAGSVRRGRDTIGDLDIIVAADHHESVTTAFRSMALVETILAAGDTKVSVRLNAGLQADLRVVEPGSFGAALLYFTGSKEHNVQLRERAIKQGLRLNEYGLYRAGRDEAAPQRSGAKPLAAATEQEIYSALGLPWIPPELREGRGELDQPVPELIEIEQIRAELHAHTIASDGRWTIAGLAAAAKERGFHTVAVTDHSRSSAQAGGLSPQRLWEHIELVRAANEKIEGIRILAGSEVDILADGTLDYDDELLAALDIVIASPHAALRQDRAKATERLLAAVRHPLVHIIGHPTGRLIGRRDGLAPDIEALIAAAVEHDVALEINANSNRLDLRDSHIAAAVDAGALLALNCDAHNDNDFDQLRYGITTARRGRLTPKQCINTWGEEELWEWLKR